MNDLARQVVANRAARDAARATFDAHYRELRADIEQRGIGGRIADEALEQARGVFDEAVAVAEAHPAAIGGTMAALALWLLRNPIIAWMEHALSPPMRKLEEPDREQDW